MKRLFFLSILFFMILLTGCDDAKPQPLRIAAAANLQYVIQPLVDAFTAKNAGAVEIIKASSGKLAAQIVAGAPYDVFVSADQMLPNTLMQQELTIGQPQTYAEGELVLWTNAVDTQLDLNILDLTTIQHFAIANPEIAPYGKASLAVLKYYRWYDIVKDKLVMGENIAQTNQFITSNNAELGLTAKSTLFAPDMQNKGTWTILNHEAYPPILQDAVVLQSAKDRKNEKRAQAFVQFLLSDKARQLLASYGYRVHR